jgi:glycosyltransferase involved in cell wall biosynthesis
MIQLSVVIITFNEERNLERCLISIKEIADDIVVLDSFSKDNTQKIAEKHGARFLQHAFDGHIEQKNRAITHAKYPHVLSLDADEALDETLIESIKKVKENFDKEGYYMNRLTNYCGTWVHHCGWYPDKKLRLWDSRLGSWGGTNPHDKYEMKNGDKNVGHLKGDILHYSYYTVDDHYKQVEYFTTILAKAQYKNGKKAPLIVWVFSPIVKFIKDFFIMKGFLDGSVGFQICKISAFATFVKYKKLRKLIQTKGLSYQ